MCAVLVIYLAAYAHVCQLGLEQSRARTQLRLARQQNDVLQAELARLQCPARVAARAEKMGMTVGTRHATYLSAAGHGGADGGRRNGQGTRGRTVAHRQTATQQQLSIIKPRARLGLGVIAGLYLLLAGRLVYLQAARHSYFQKQAEAYRVSKHILPALRGDILDRNGSRAGDGRHHGLGRLRRPAGGQGPRRHGPGARPPARPGRRPRPGSAHAALRQEPLLPAQAPRPPAGRQHASRA